MRITLFVFTIALLSLCACTPKGQLQSAKLPKPELSAEEMKAHKTDMPQFLAGAVLYGMEGDRFPPELAEKLERNSSNWVGKCPLCDNVRRGMNAYLASTKGAIKTHLVSSVREALSSDDDAIRRPAIQALVDKYVKEYYTALGMTDEERAAMQSKLEAGRKKGMGLAGGGEGFFCPSCDGACGIPKH